jgi:hypothetical protein
MQVSFAFGEGVVVPIDKLCEHLKKDEVFFTEHYKVRPGTISSAINPLPERDPHPPTHPPIHAYSSLYYVTIVYFTLPSIHTHKHTHTHTHTY